MIKFSKEWFKNKLNQFNNMQEGTFKRLTRTKGLKPITDQDEKYSKKQQRIRDLKKLAKEKGVEL